MTADAATMPRLRWETRRQASGGDVERLRRKLGGCALFDSLSITLRPSALSISRMIVARIAMAVLEVSSVRQALSAQTTCHHAKLGLSHR